MSYFSSALSGNQSVHTYDGPVFEGYDESFGGEHQIAMESYQENFEIVQLLSQMASTDALVTRKVDVAVMESAGEAVLESLMEEQVSVLEAAGSGVIERAKNFLKKLWGKVKAFFASIGRSLDLLTKSGQDFVKKYKKELEKLKLAGMKETMYQYTLEDLNIEDAYKAATETTASAASVVISVLGSAKGMGADDSHDKVDSAISDFRDKKDDRLDEFRGKILGGSATKMDGSDFREAVKKKLRGGADDKEERNVNIHAIISELEGTSKLKSKIDKAQREADKFFGDRIKELDNMEKAFNKDGGGAKIPTGGTSTASINGLSNAGATKAATVASIISSEVSAKQAIVNTVFSEWNSAVKERDAAYKAVIRKAFSYKEKN